MNLARWQGRYDGSLVSLDVFGDLVQVTVARGKIEPVAVIMSDKEFASFMAGAAGQVARRLSDAHEHEHTLSGLR